MSRRFDWKQMYYSIFILMKVISCIEYGIHVVSQNCNKMVIIYQWRIKIIRRKHYIKISISYMCRKLQREEELRNRFSVSFFHVSYSWMKVTWITKKSISWNIKKLFTFREFSNIFSSCMQSLSFNYRQNGKR